MPWSEIERVERGRGYPFGELRLIAPDRDVWINPPAVFADPVEFVHVLHEHAPQAVTSWRPAPEAADHAR
jgi:hypothetical protein